MRAGIRKIIWIIFTIQLLLFHGWLVLLIRRLCFRYSYLLYKVVYKFSLPDVIASHFTFFIVAGWGIIALTVLLFQLFCYITFRNNCYRKAMPILDQGQKSMFREIAEKYAPHIKGWSFYQSEDITSPFVLGFRKPVLMVPSGYQEDDDAMSLIFEHECGHIRCHDNLYKLFLVICNSLLWYQPIMYLVKHLAIMDVEVACDEAVVEEKSDDERYSYGKLIIRNLDRQNANKAGSWSSFFYNTKSVMKTRISAIMEHSKKTDYVAYVMLFILLAETLGMVGKIHNRALNFSDEQQAVEEAEKNIYLGYNTPESFSNDALDIIIDKADKIYEKDTIQTDIEVNDESEQEDIDITVESKEGPWQTTEVADYNEAFILFMNRYYMYFDNQERGRDISVYGYAPLTLTYGEPLMENQTGCIYYGIFRIYNEIYEIPDTLNMSGVYGMNFDSGSWYECTYYCVTAYIEKSGEVYQLKSVIDGKIALEEFKDRYPDKDYSEVAVLVPVEYEKSLIKYRIFDGTLELSYDGGNTWETTPISASNLFERGDEMDGRLSDVQDGSAQLDDNKIVFVYGGSKDIPLTASYIDEAGQWQESVISDEIDSVRQIYVDFPEDNKVGYVVATAWRTVWQEMSLVYKTYDGGKTWENLGYCSSDTSVTHSLTTGMDFINNTIGFISVRSSETPELWRTMDGGVTWKRIFLPESETTYTYSMAYPPELLSDGSLALYVGAEDSGRYYGEKEYYISEDTGKTWSYQGIVIRQ